MLEEGWYRMLQDRGCRERHVLISDFLLSAISLTCTSVQKLLIQTPLLLPRICILLNLVTYKQMHNQRTHLEMANFHPFVSFLPSLSPKQSLGWLRNDVTRYNSVQRKMSLRYCFSNTKATSQLESQTVGILLLPSTEKKQVKCASKYFPVDLFYTWL